MYRKACKLETIYENSSDEEISFTFQSQLEINPIATTSSTNAFDGNRSTISSKGKQRNITPKSSTTRVVENKRNVINPNLSLPLPQDTNSPGEELITRRYAINCINSILVSTHSNILNNFDLQNVSSPNLHNRPDLYSENDDKKTQSNHLVFSFKVHFHWIYPSTPLVLNYIEIFRYENLKKIVGEENNDKVVLKHLIKSGKVSEIKTDAMWKYLSFFWTDDVEVSIVKKELLE
ncbi:hypothetical protein F8M41_018979 [Gigaspora margarita]|uniref:Uncharacterized protein n=1 Tax=Gigaspora margarita TaxID=4874 RepID=A0A8H4EKW8_GIGMA|nr:hypothetical protein F8M41_018979 [Gigaspora margarita]